MLSQELQILRDLNRGKRITPLDALRDYNCWALSSRIADLNKRLIQQKKRKISVRMVTHNGKRFAEYWRKAA